MPWDITIFSGTSPEDSTLGPRAAVVSQLAAALPGAQLEQPPSVPEEFLAQMPEAVRAVMNRPNSKAVLNILNSQSRSIAARAPPLTRSAGRFAGMAIHWLR